MDVEMNDREKKMKPSNARRRVFGVKKEACSISEPERTLIIPQLKKVHAFILFAVIWSFFIINGFYVNVGFPTMLYISYFASAVVYTNIFKDTVFLNSIAAPFAFISVADTIADIVYQTDALWIHLPVAVIVTILVNTRRKFDLSYMIAASILYSIWLYTIYWYFFGNFVDPIYAFVPAPFNDAAFLAFMTGVGTMSTSVGIWFFRSRCSSPLAPYAKRTIW